MADFAGIDAARAWELMTVEWSVLGIVAMSLGALAGHGSRKKSMFGRSKVKSRKEINRRQVL